MDKTSTSSPSGVVVVDGNSISVTVTPRDSKDPLGVGGSGEGCKPGIAEDLEIENQVLIPMEMEVDSDTALIVPEPTIGMEKEKETFTFAISHDHDYESSQHKKQRFEVDLADSNEPTLWLSLPWTETIGSKNRLHTSSSSSCADLEEADNRCLLQYISEEKHNLTLKLLDRAAELERQLEEKDRATQKAEKLRLQTLQLAESEYREKALNEVKNIVEAELSCSICNEVFIEPAVLRCGHTFCGHCIKRALQLKNACPFCRADSFNRPTMNSEMREYITKIYAALPEEARMRRDQVVQERNSLPLLDPNFNVGGNVRFRLQRAQGVPQEQGSRRGRRTRIEVFDNLVRGLRYPSASASGPGISSAARNPVVTAGSPTPAQTAAMLLTRILASMRADEVNNNMHR